jgi:TetR/AcrR family transcriptional regulator, regulator of biofilm formation and stress response
MTAAESSTRVLGAQVRTYWFRLAPVSRAEASRRVRESIVAATVAIVAREGVGALTHRRVATEAGVSLSSTTWHFAAKADILQAALTWTAEHEVARIAEIADRLGGTAFDREAWADALAGWLIGQVTTEREIAVALYRLQIELADSLPARETHHAWGRGLRALGARVLEDSAASDLDIRLVVSALDGLRLSVLLSGEDPAWLRDAVRRQLQALLG